MPLKAKQTYYNGYWFRSRLEARWAYFFDLIGIEYRYEYQGYELDGISYLPDFWLTGRYNLYVEIKGYTPDALELEKASRLATASERLVWLFVGDPFGPSELCSFIFHNWEMYKESPRDIMDKYYLHDHIIDINERGYTTLVRSDKVVWSWIGETWFPGGESSLDKDAWFHGDQSKLMYAQLKARQARFEYGETPSAPWANPSNEN